jgi:signal transduction histidine kinase
VFISTVEVVANSVSQAPLLNGWNWVLLVMALFPVIGMLVWAWRYSVLGVWPYLHGFSTLLVMLMWPWIVVDGNALPADFQPWIWWALGLSAMSIGITAPLWIGILYLVTAPTIWFFLDTSYFGGSSDPWVSLQDSVYVFLIAGTVSGLLLMVRQAARITDEANSAVIASAIAQARTDAIERERQRIDALVHDRVLNTLVLAAKAHSKEDQAQVTQMAIEAIESLSEAGDEPDFRSKTTLLGLYRALRKAALRMGENVEVHAHSGGLQELPSEVALAITEATIQALDNAIRHSKAERITLSLGATSDHDLLIEVRDNGIGFRPERAARDRIGLRTSIIARLKAVRGLAEIKSELGRGTTITIRWSE